MHIGEPGGWRHTILLSIDQVNPGATICNYLESNENPKVEAIRAPIKRLLNAAA